MSGIDFPAFDSRTSSVIVNNDDDDGGLELKKASACFLMGRPEVNAASWLEWN